jgi:hypothetical protein
MKGSCILIDPPAHTERQQQSKTMTTKSNRPHGAGRHDDTYGLCPICKECGDLLPTRQGAWLVCDRHRVFWSMGVRRIWRPLTEENEEVLGRWDTEACARLRFCSEVEPFYWPKPLSWRIRIFLERWGILPAVRIAGLLVSPRRLRNILSFWQLSRRAWLDVVKAGTLGPGAYYPISFRVADCLERIWVKIACRADKARR